MNNILSKGRFKEGWIMVLRPRIELLEYFCIETKIY